MRGKRCSDPPGLDFQSELDSELTSELARNTLAILATLSPREEKILKERFGIGGRRAELGLRENPLIVFLSLLSVLLELATLADLLWG